MAKTIKVLITFSEFLAGVRKIFSKGSVYNLPDALADDYLRIDYVTEDIGGSGTNITLGKSDSTTGTTTYAAGADETTYTHGLSTCVNAYVVDDLGWKADGFIIKWDDSTVKIQGELPAGHKIIAQGS